MGYENKKSEYAVKRMVGRGKRVMTIDEDNRNST